MVTSGTGGLYPPNIPVAIVVSRQDDGALERPLADPAKVDAVAVLRPYTPDTIEAQAVPATTTHGAPLTVLARASAKDGSTTRREREEQSGEMRVAGGQLNTKKQ